MVADVPLLLRSLPGVKRDGTPLEGQNYVEAQWCRFQRSLPRKMRGMRMVTNQFTGVPRGIFMNSRDGLSYIDVGISSGIFGLTMDSNGQPTNIVDRTPGGFAPSGNNLWQLDSMYNAAGAQSSIIAHAGLNLSNIDNSVVSPVYIGNMYDTTALTAIAAANNSGGIVVINPYLFAYGNDGFVQWSDINQPTLMAAGSAGSARICSAKIVKGLHTRGGNGAGPSGLFWSLDALVRGTFIGGAPVFNFDTVDGYHSVLSSSCIVPYDGQFYWPGIDRFLRYNGVIDEIANGMNIDFFYDNLNWTHRQKVFGFAIPRWGEIWWCAPLFGATECNWAIIHNVREKTWYDTPLVDGRSCAFTEQMQLNPVLGSTITEPGGSGGYALWQHETGVDRIAGQNIKAIKSYFITNKIFRATDNPPKDNALHVERVELDLVQTGQMELTLGGSVNARAIDVKEPVMTFEPTDAFVLFKTERRQLYFKFQSNVVGGDYQMGDTLLWQHDGTNRKT